MVKIITDSIPWLSKGTYGHALFSNASTQPPVPKYVLASTTSEEASPQRRIATRGTELFVGAGCQIRCVDLRDLKARYEEESIMGSKEGTQKDVVKSIGEPEKGYQVLDIPELDFHIHQLEVSPDGNYMCIVGEKRLAVCMLPTPGFARLNMETLRARSCEVGKAFYNDSSERIVRAIWHPFGVDGASLVILTSDAVIRIFDFTMHLQHTFEQPDQIFDLNVLSGQDRHKTSFTPEPEAFEPASCFPSRWRAPPEYLHSLEIEISSTLDALIGSSEATVQDKLALRQQTKWMNEIMEQQSSVSESNHAAFSLGGRKKQDWFTRPESAGPSPQLQGPFLLQPAPVDMSSDEVYACDIIHIISDPISIISIVWSNGNVDICLEFEPIGAKWVGKKVWQKVDKHNNMPSIASFETIALDVPLPENSARKNWPVFVENPLVSEIVFVAHYGGVEAVDMTEWIKGLKVVLDQNEGEAFIAKLLKRAQGSSVQKVVNSGGTLPNLPHPIKGCAVLQDSYLGYILLAHSDLMVYATDFDIPIQLQESVEVGIPFGQLQIEGASGTGNSRRVTELPGYIANIPQPLYDPPPFLSEMPSLHAFKAFQQRQNPQLVRDSLTYSAETLDILRQARELVKREYEKVMTIAETMYSRAKLQKAEYERQLLKINEIISKQDALRTSNINGRLQDALKKQQELTNRSDALIRQLIRKGLGPSGENGGVELSEREKEWMAEIKKVEQRISGPGGLDKRKERTEGLLNELKPLVEIKENGNEEDIHSCDDRGDGVPKEVREKKIQELKALLEKETFLIETTKAKAERLEAKCEVMGL
ncbi:hypothetical protein BDZ91DRAFT_724807 [Kalaharituber pfeilii]|nr:hypothetical protein BDZ91DRAFT_724807 [Kalaharituber pfeilii]